MILRWRGEGALPDSVAERVQTLDGVSVLGSSVRMLRVEGDAASVHEMFDSDEQVDVFDEMEAQHIAPPNLSIKPRRGP